MSTRQPDSSNFLTIAEVAAAIRLSKMTVYRLVQSHEIEAVRFGRQYRVSETAVDQYIERSALSDTPG
ncbi:helix-turn-helix domain-containing protein [Arthrobacter sp. GMC3]|uniref:helix-turn-helix domain-containing protein n=1 Tax=Arthrobacter sp. GMC3 TaxID=2058894 RepID=UPI000CE5469D|nr:helix-turn-helix domain-containing protein [Arthrobacter sp. GMC3]